MVGLSIVAVTVAVVAEPDKPATKGRENLRGEAPVPVPATAPAVPRAAAAGTLYRPPRWWQRLRPVVLLVILATIVGATLAAIVGAVLALAGLGVREAVS